MYSMLHHILTGRQWNVIVVFEEDEESYEYIWNVHAPSSKTRQGGDKNEI